VIGRMLEHPPAVKPREAFRSLYAAMAATPTTGAAAAVAAAAGPASPKPTVPLSASLGEVTAVAALRAERDTLATALATARAEAQSAKAALSDRDGTVASLQSEMESCRREMERLRSELAVRDAQLASASGSGDSTVVLQQQVLALTAKLGAVTSQREGMVSTLRDRDATIAELQTEVAKLKSAAPAPASASATGDGPTGALSPSLVDCELSADTVTITRNSRGDRHRLGGGAFGDVYSATFGAQPVVVKVPRLPGGMHTAPPDMLAVFWRETRTQFVLRHPNIVTVHGGYTFVDPAAGGVVEMGVVMERCSGGTLEARLHRPGAPATSLRQRLGWALQTMSALAYLHARDIIHADVKPENVLLEDETAEARAKLCDFGLSVKRRDDSVTRASLLTFRGSLAYVDSRMLAAGSDSGAPGDTGAIRKASDVYSVGVMLWECAVQQRPYGSLAFPPEALASPDLQQAHFVRHVRSGGRPATGEELAVMVPGGLGGLIGRMWSGRAEERPTMAGAVEELGRLLAGLVG